MNQNTKQKRSAASWLAELAKGRYGEYALSVLTALLGVACSLIPYFIIIRLITALVNGTAELTYCLTLCAWMAGCWVLRYVLHSVSTSLSHHATFHVLANTRTRLLDKLATLPLGTVLDHSSGSYKNIIVERVDSIETTLAHLLPEMTANIVGALAVLVLLFIEDWRMGLSMLIVVPLGIICFMSMFSGYNEKFQRTVTATKTLNDTAVEYISGIEVIKAFGQSKTSYAKFVSAAKEGADCFIDWMRGSLFGQVAGMAILPSTLLGILPVGCLLYMHGTLSAETFLTVIVLSFGVMQPLITAFSYTDDIAQVTTIVGEVAEVLSGEDTLTGLLLFFAVNAAMQRAEQALSQRKFNADERLVSKVLEYVQGIAEVKNFDLTHDSATQVHGAVEEARRASFAMEIPSVLYMLAQFVVNKLTGVAVCVAAIVFYFGGTMELTNCLLMLICSFILFEQLDSAGSFSALFRSIDIGVDKANAILRVEPMDIDGEDLSPEREDITLSHVDFSYDSKPILHDVSLTIPEKTTVAIVGPSGSGKTTLCNLMARFWDVQSGSVSLGGHDVREYSYDSLIRNFSFVFQRTYLFSDTIANNIRFGKPDASMEEVQAAAKKARCYDFIMALPDGFDTVIGEAGSSLSGGERQRISIARAIMKDAPIIILDEATANVDPENEKELMEAVSELTHDKTVIMIAHRLKTVRHADKIFVVDHGEIVQQGTHDELVAVDGLYRRFVVERQQAAGWKV